MSGLGLNARGVLIWINFTVAAEGYERFASTPAGSPFHRLTPQSPAGVFPFSGPYVELRIAVHFSTCERR